MTNIRSVSFFPYLLGAAFVVGMFWLWFFLEHQFGISIKGNSLSPDEEPLPIWVPSVATPLSIIGAGYFYRKAYGIASRGIEITAEIKSIGALGIKGIRDITIQYTVANRTYKKKKSVVENLAASLKKGDSIDLIVDPSRPNNYLLKDEL